MIQLNDCGSIQALTPGQLGRQSFIAHVTMVIKAPRGTMALFERTGLITEDEQCSAIKAFMEQHNA